MGLIKQFVKALDGNENCFHDASNKFSEFSEAKVKEGIFVGPQIRKLTKDKMSEWSMTPAEKKAWISFKEVIDKFLRNSKDSSYEQVVHNMLQKYKVSLRKMSLKLGFLFSHLDQFPEKRGAVSEKRVKCFTKTSRRWKDGGTDDGCDECEKMHKRKSGRINCQSKGQRFY